MEFSKKFVCECLEYSSYGKNVPAPIFRKSFELKNKAERAEILICGLGFYDLFVNGKKITKGYLAPYISNSDHICYYDKYDLKEYLNIGENVIGVMLGDGHQNTKYAVWDFIDNNINSAPLLSLTLEIESEQDNIHFEADDFVCKKGPILFNDLRSGVFYDARLEEDGWNNVGFFEKDWHKPVTGVYKPRGTKKICEAEPIKVSKELKPISIKKGELASYRMADHAAMNPPFFESPAEKTGGYIYDFGENNAGTLRLKIKGEKGQKISLQCGEQLVDGKLSYSNVNFYPDGFSQRDIYYLKGEGEEIFEPMFTYHGFRYVYVYGITEEQATEDLLTYLVMSSDLEKRGSFECSDEVANKIFEISQRSDISNFYYIQTDCPHREKNGWTGDASMSSEHIMLTLGAENSWREWLNNIRLTQKSDGQLPGIVPTGNWGYDWGNGPAWDSIIFNLPYMAYKYRGETKIIEENATAMLRYLEYVSRKRDEKGIVAIGLGDLLPVVRNDGGRQSDASLGFTDSVMVLDMCRKGAEMFDAINLPMHKAFAKKLEEEILEAIRNEYIDFDTFVVDKRYQTTQAMAIFYNVFTEDEKTKAFEVLKEIIKEDNYSITTGFLGIRVIFHVLSDFGEYDLAYKMITKPEYPSYGYWVSKGETTLLENFKEYDEYFGNSKNHHFFGDVENWLMSCPGGIKVQNANEVIISPKFVNVLSWCKASHKMKNGEIKVFWERKDDNIILKVEKIGDIKVDVKIDNNYNIVNENDNIYTIKKA